MDYIAMHARLRPDHTALADLASARQWTYSELEQYVAGCVSVLSAAGMGQGDRVACLAKNCAQFVVLHAACARLGALFVPLNWRLSVKELGFLLDDSEPRLLFGDDQARKLGFECEAIDTLETRSVDADPAGEVSIDPDRPSLILYTSGTTGRPKGVLLGERNLTETAINFTLLGNVNAGSTFLCDAPMYHVIGLVANIRPALFSGGRVLISDGFVPERTLQRMMDPELRITHYFCVPQMAKALRESEAFDPVRLQNLTAIFTGGAPHPESRIREWLGDGIAIVDGFGMSEAGTVFGMPVDPRLVEREAGSVGIPTPRVQARLVDADNTEVAVGAAGDLQIRGDNVFGGYWGLEDESVAAFTEDGWFRTGDIATRNDDGYYRIVDRRKDMFISGGENVYPAEVEAAVSAHSQVAECAVVGVPDKRWGEVGFLFAVGQPDADLIAKALLETLNGTLARYKIPKHALVVDRLPRNGAGKVLKSELKEAAIRQMQEENP